MLKKEKEKFYAIMIIAALTGLVLIWQGIFVSRAAIGNKILQIRDKKASIGAYNQREKTLSAVLDNYNSAKEKIDEVNERFMSGINSADVDKIFSGLENIAAETSILLEKVFIENPEAVKNPVKKPAVKDTEQPAEEDKFLRLTIKGKYENLLDFISKLEAMPYYLDIKSVNIGASTIFQRESSGEKDNLPAELRGVIIVKVFKKQNIDDKK